MDSLSVPRQVQRHVFSTAGVCKRIFLVVGRHLLYIINAASSVRIITQLLLQSRNKCGCVAETDGEGSGWVGVRGMEGKECCPWKC